MSDHLDRLMRKVDMLEQDNKRLFARLDRVERAIDELKVKADRWWQNPPFLAEPAKPPPPPPVFLDD